LFFSIIIPTYNRSGQIFDTIHSIDIQNHKDFEIIVIDDGSIDDTAEKVEKFCILNPNLKIKLKTLSINSGPNIARNIGSEMAEGKYLIFLDSDDQFYNIDSLAIMKNTILELSNPGLLMFSSLYTNGDAISQINFTKLTFKQFLINNKNIGEFLPVVESSLFKKVLFRTNIRGGEGITWLEITKLTNEIFYSHKVTRIYNNINENRLSTFSLAYCNRLYSVHKTFFIKFYPDLLSNYPVGFLKTSTRIIFYKIASYKYLNYLIIKIKKHKNEI